MNLLPINPHPLFKSIIAAAVLSVIAVTMVFGQQLEVGGGLGTTTYRGDIYPNFKPFAFNVGANALVRYNFVQSGVSVKATGMLGYLSAKDSRVNNAFNQLRGANFTTNIFDAGLQVEYNFLDFRSTAIRDAGWTPYVFGGFNYYGVFNGKYAVDAPANGGFVFSDYQVRTSSKRGGYAIPFGIGFKKAIRPQLNLSFEFGARKTFSDVIIDNIGFEKSALPEVSDKVSNFPNASNATDPVERRITTPNTRLFDMYYYTNVSLSYVFYRVHCPPGR